MDLPADIPPPTLRVRVFYRGRDVDGFIRGGDESRAAIERGLAAAGRHLTDFDTALDFGCGCGRTLRAFRDQTDNLAMFGTDTDAEAIAWCRDHLGFARFTLNRALPPLPYGDNAFDLAWAISVFTHLDERMQFLWLDELARTTAPGGSLVASFHGEHTWSGLPSRTVARIRRDGLLYSRTGGFKGVLPDWYQTTWHTQDYVRENWSRFFDVVEIIERGVHGYQDLVVLRRQ